MRSKGMKKLRRCAIRKKFDKMQKDLNKFVRFSDLPQIRDFADLQFAHLNFFVTSG